MDRWFCADAPATATALKMMANAARRATVVLKIPIVPSGEGRLR
jgi:hypothetical protein